MSEITQIILAVKNIFKAGFVAREDFLLPALIVPLCLALIFFFFRLRRLQPRTSSSLLIVLTCALLSLGVFYNHTREFETAGLSCGDEKSCLNSLERRGSVAGEETTGNFSAIGRSALGGQSNSNDLILSKIIFTPVISGDGTVKYKTGDLMIKSNGLIRIQTGAIGAREIENGSIQDADIDDDIDLTVETIYSRGTMEAGGDLIIGGNTIVTNGQINVGDKVITQGDIGVGISVPLAKLHVHQTSPSGNEVLFLISTGDDSSRFSVDEDGDFTADGNLILGGTIDTGMGATEVYLMNQNVRTADAPTFAGLTLNGTLALGNNGIDGTNYDISAAGIITGATWNGAVIADGYIANDITLANLTQITSRSHSDLQNLLADDHTQYALLAGRAGGQTLIGGTAASETLTLQSTSNGTKGKILFGTSAYDEVNNYLGIGTASPGHKFVVAGGDVAVGYSGQGTNPVLHIYGSGTSGAAEQLLYMNGTTGVWHSGHGKFLMEPAGMLSISPWNAVDNAYIEQARFGQSGGLAIGRNYIATTPPSQGMIIEGNVGIGTASPGTLLDLKQNVNTNVGGLRIVDTTGNNSIRLWIDASGVQRIDNGNDASGRISLNGAGTGNVGIGGLASASYKLNITGSLMATGAITTNAMYYGGGANLDINQFNSGYMRFLTGNVEQMRITSTGNIGIGIAAPTSRIHGVTTLSAATGDEIAYQLNYTVNKLTSGNDTGLLINMTDTLSPGNSNLLELQVAGAWKMYVNNIGQMWTQSSIGAGSGSGNFFGGGLHYSTNNTLTIQGSGVNFSTSDNAIEMATGIFSGAGVAQNAVVIKPTWNQSTTSSATDLLINRTQTAVGSGAQYLIDAQVGGASKFSVSNAGQCVTGDSLLPIIQSEELPNPNSQFPIKSQIQNVQIKDIKGGEYVMSLNEETGKLVPARIKGLLDMGVKPIYEIETEDGKKIRTTGNHPYLVKTSKLLADNTDSIFPNNSQSISKSAAVFYGIDKTQNSAGNFISFKLSDQNNNDSVAAGNIKAENISETAIESQENSFAAAGEIKNSVIVGPDQVCFADSQNIKTVFSDSVNNISIYAFVGEKSDHKNLTGFNFQYLFFAKDPGGIVKGGHCFSFGYARVLLGNVFDDIAGLQEINEIGNGDSGSRDARFSETDGLFDGNSFRKISFSDFHKNIISDYSADNTIINEKSVKDTIKNANWTKVIYLSEGDEIAAASKNLNEAEFVKIKKITILPPEQVYDIEVEGTHNFVANGIIAHNTYIDSLTASKPVFTDASKNLVSTGTLGADQGGTGLVSYAIGDLIYASGATTLAKLADVATGSVLISGGVGTAPSWGALSSLDHGSLGGLTVDDHTQYALLAGRAGGQTLIGGSAASETLTLQSTSHATKGKILFGTSAYDEVNNRLGIGTTSPGSKLAIEVPTLTTEGLSIKSTDDNAANYAFVVRNSAGAVKFRISPAGSVYFGSDISVVEGGGLSNNATGFEKIYLGNTNGIQFFTGAASAIERMRIDTTNGNVGIGTTSPGFALDVVGNIKASLAVWAGSGDSYLVSGGIENSTSSNNSKIYTSITGIKITRNVADANPALVLQQAHASSTGDILQVKNNSSTVLTVQQGGNVGIGTTNPGAALDVSSINNGAVSYVRVLNPGSSASIGTGAGISFMPYSTSLVTGSIESFRKGASDYPLVFKGINSGLTLTEYMRIATGGNVGIGTTSPTSRIHGETTLSAATGNEIAYQLNYTTNKATSGNDTGLLINMTDTLSPGSSYPLEIKVGGNYVGGFLRNSYRFESAGLDAYAGNISLGIQSKNFSLDNYSAVSMLGGTVSNTGGTFTGVAIVPIYNQTSGTAANTDLLINRTQTAVGSGAQLLIDAQVGGVSKFYVRNDGLYLGVYGVATNYFQTPRLIAASGATPNYLTIQNITFNETSGTIVPVKISPTYNQASGTAANTDLLINRTETAVGSGAQLLIDAQVGGVSKFYVNNIGYGVASDRFTAPGGGFDTIFSKTDTVTLGIQNRSFTVTDNAIEMAYGTFSGAGVTQNAVVIKPTWNQTTTSSATDLLINRTQTAVGSGAQLLIDAQVGGVSKFSVSNTGVISGIADPLAQYALLAGRAGGQTLIGGTASGNNLTLTSNSPDDGMVASTSNFGIKGGKSLRLYNPTNGGYASLWLDSSEPNRVNLNYSLVIADATLFGSNSSGGNLTLQSTTHATKGKILFGTSAYDEVNNRLGIGNATPVNALDVGSNTTGLNASINATLGTELAPALEAVNWTCGAGWTAAGGTIVKASSANYTTCTPSAATSIVAGTTYKIVVTVSAFSGAVLYLNFGGTQQINISAVSTQTYYITAITTAKIYFITELGTDTATISSLSIKALTDATGDLNVDGDLYLNSKIISPVGLNFVASGNQAFRFNTGSSVLGMSGNYIRFFNPTNFIDASYSGAAKFIFRTSNATSLDTNAMTILGSGNVGIGTTNPTGSLVVQPVANSTSSVQFLNSSGSSVLSVDTTNGLIRAGTGGGAGNNVAIGWSGTAAYNGIWFNTATPSVSNYSFLGNGSNTYFNAPDGYIRFAINNTDKMAINSSGGLSIGSTYNLTDAGANNVIIEGNVGIGIAAPTSRIHGVTTLSAATGNEIAYQLNYTVNKLTSGNSTGLLINMTETSAPGTDYILDLQVGGVSKFSVDNGGYIRANNIAVTGVYANTVGGKTSNDTYVVYPRVTYASNAYGTDIVAWTPITGVGNVLGFVAIRPTYNQTAATSVTNTDLLINRTETSLGTTPGMQYLIDAQVGGVSKFKVDNTGVTTAKGNIVTEGTFLGWTIATPSGISPLTISNGGSSTANNFNVSMVTGTLSQTSGINGAVKITPIYNQTSGTASNTDLLINRTQTAVGSGAQLLIDAQVGGASKFSVSNAGQCVTGDSELITENGETLRIDQVKGGEYVLSLNEETGKLVPAKIKGLLDMGVKPIYEIETEDGKKIRTTANHPYLTKQGWTKIASLNEGEEIAIVKENLFLLLDGDQNNQADGNGQKSAEDIDVNHSIVNHNYFLANNKPSDQKINASIKPKIITDQLNFSEKSGSIKTEAKNTWAISRQASDKNSNLIKGKYMQSNYSESQSDVKFSKIKKITILPPEQVYDIEVEGTHNFVANGIIAHNTYIDSLTASKPVFTDASKNLVSTGTLGADQGGTGLASYAIGDLIYASGATTLAKLADVATGSVLISGGVGTAPSWGALSGIDHGSLGGLTDDDHSIYALLAGRAGGQTLIGGSAASETLTLQSTSHATKGKILFGTSAYDEVNNRLGIGTTTPGQILEVVKNQNALTQLLLSNTTAGASSQTQLSVTSDGGNVVFKALSSSFTTSGINIANTAQLRSSSGLSNGLVLSTGTTAPIIFGINDTEAMRISSTGNVGIGTTSPLSLLSVGAGTAVGAGTPLYVYGDSGAPGFGAIAKFQRSAGEKSLYIRALAGTFTSIESTGELRLLVGATDSATSVAGLFLADTTGYLGVGELVPLSRLSVNGGISAGTYSATAAPANGMIISGNVGIGIAAPTSRIHGVTTLSAATGNEIAYQLNYTTNKATSGNDTGLLINMTDTLSPGVSNLIDLQRGGVSKFRVDSDGSTVVSNTFYTDSHIYGGGNIRLGSGGILHSYANDNTLLIQNRDFTVSDNSIEMAYGTFSGADKTQAAVVIKPTYNTSGTSSATDLLINRTETAVGSGAQLLIDAQVGGVSKFSVRNDGAIFPSGGVWLSQIGNYTSGTSGTSLIFQPWGGSPATGTNPGTSFNFGGTVQNQRTAGQQNMVSINPVYNQASGTAANTDLLINRTETAVGSGAQLLIDAQVGGVSKFSVSNAGAATIAGTVTLSSVGAMDANDTYVCRDPTSGILTTGATCTASSLRYKKNIADMAGGLNTVMQLRPVTFDWKYNNRPGLGFIAEEVEQINPVLVTYDDEGNVSGLHYDWMSAILTKAVQELASSASEQQNILETHSLQLETQNMEITVQTQNLASLQLKTGENITTIAGLKISTDKNLEIISQNINDLVSGDKDLNNKISVQTQNLASLQSQLSDHETRIKSVEDLTDALQAQMDELKKVNNQELNVAQIDANKTDIEYLKLLLGTDRVKNPGDIDILGKMTAQITETGALAIKIIDKDSPTIGEAAIQAGETSIEVKTKAADKDSEIFITPKNIMTDQQLVVIQKKEGISFSVAVKNPAESGIEFSWWIVDKK